MLILAPDSRGLEAAVRALRDGNIVAYPTETVYGLAVDPFSPAALRRLYTAKARDPSRPVLLVIGSREQLRQVVSEPDSRARACIAAFWPGPLSILLPKAEALPDLVANDEGRVCVRQTAHPLAARLCLEFGGPITSTSANRSGEAPALRPQDIPDGIAQVCLDGGALEPSPPSSVYDCERDVLLREGAVSRARLDEIIKPS